jgi:hypothetical protein
MSRESAGKRMIREMHTAPVHPTVLVERATDYLRRSAGSGQADGPNQKEVARLLEKLRREQNHS